MTSDKLIFLHLFSFCELTYFDNFIHFANTMVGMAVESDKFLHRLYCIFQMGLVVRIVEGMEEEDWDNGETWFTTLNDRQFRMRNGEVFCKGGSVMFPPPATDEDGWEMESVDKWFFGEMYDDELIYKVYVLVDGHEVPVWTKGQGWDNSKNFLNAAWLEAATKAEKPKEPMGVMSLRLLAAEVARDNQGVIALREYENHMDYETRVQVLSPASWWISG